MNFVRRGGIRKRTKNQASINLIHHCHCIVHWCWCGHGSCNWQFIFFCNATNQSFANPNIHYILQQWACLSYVRRGCQCIRLFKGPSVLAASGKRSKRHYFKQRVVDSASGVLCAIMIAMATDATVVDGSILVMRRLLSSNDTNCLASTHDPLLYYPTDYFSDRNNTFLTYHSIPLHYIITLFTDELSNECIAWLVDR
jgi:hypothetical protein